MKPYETNAIIYDFLNQYPDAFTKKTMIQSKIMF